MAIPIPKTLQQAIEYFSDEARAHAFAVAMRWPNGVACPTCGSLNVGAFDAVIRKPGKPDRVRRLFQCREKHLKPQFTIKTGSIFEDSPLPLKHWLCAMWMLSNCKNGVSSYEIARALGITQKSAWFLLHRLRFVLQDKTSGGKLGGDVEVDETYIGGKARTVAAKKKSSVMKTKDFLDKCRQAGCIVKASGSAWDVLGPKGRARGTVHIAGHVRQMDGNVVRTYTKQLGLSKLISGLHLDEFQAGADPEQRFIRQFRGALNRLSTA